jgi:hypothetical protein
MGDSTTEEMIMIYLIMDEYGECLSEHATYDEACAELHRLRADSPLYFEFEVVASEPDDLP